MKIQRVVRRSMSAKVSMAASAFERGDFIRAALSEIMHGRFVLKDWKLWANRWRRFLVIDAKTGFDVLTSESQTSHRKIQIDLAVLKQALNRSNSFARWVPEHHMVSDGLTKWFGNKAVQRALSEGIWSLKDSPEAAELRQTAAEQRRKLKAHRADQGGMSETRVLSYLGSGWACTIHIKHSLVASAIGVPWCQKNRTLIVA